MTGNGERRLGERVRVGVVGGGLIAQAIHLPNLRRLRDRFELVSLADPSLRVRTAVAARFDVPRTHESWEQLVDAGGIDAVVVCTPHSAHAEVIVASVESGLHVLVEKPLCVRLEDADRIVAAQQRSGRVVAVGYMKRYDPAYELLLQELAAGSRDLRYLSTTTYDPDMVREPFFRAGELVRADDVAPATLERMRHDRLQQLEQEIGTTDPAAVQAYDFTYLAALSHDVNMLHGVLDAIGETADPQVRASAWWADGWAGGATLGLSSGAQCASAWLWLDGLEEYRGELAAYTPEAVHSVTFATPYLGWPSTYRQRAGTAAGAQREQRTVATGQGYVEELLHFHDCIVAGAVCRTPPEQARRDMRLLHELFIAAEEERRREAEPVR